MARNAPMRYLAPDDEIFQSNCFSDGKWESEMGYTMGVGSTSQHGLLSSFISW